VAWRMRREKSGGGGGLGGGGLSAYPFCRWRDKKLFARIARSSPQASPTQKLELALMDPCYFLVQGRPRQSRLVAQSEKQGIKDSDTSIPFPLTANPRRPPCAYATTICGDAAPLIVAYGSALTTGIVAFRGKSIFTKHPGSPSPAKPPA